MGPVEVRTLAGKSVVLSLTAGDNARTIKYQLRALWGNNHRLMLRASRPCLLICFLASCRPSLFCMRELTRSSSAQGSTLDDSMPVAELHMGPGEFLVRCRQTCCTRAFAFLALLRPLLAL